MTDTEPGQSLVAVAGRVRSKHLIVYPSTAPNLKAEPGIVTHIITQAWPRHNSIQHIKKLKPAYIIKASLCKSVAFYIREFVSSH